MKTEIYEELVKMLEGSKHDHDCSVEKCSATWNSTLDTVIAILKFLVKNK